MDSVRKPLAVALVSGGMDSLVTAAIANMNHEIALLHVNYGQRTESRELKAFNEIADHYNVTRRMIVDIDYLSKIGGSSLTDPNIEVSKAKLDSSHGIPTSYVPFRNSNILAIATSWAEVICAEKIYIGAVEEDSSGYPDCREIYYEAFNKVIELGSRSGSDIKIETPIIHLKKHEIVRWGAELNVPFELSWSCYKNEGKACGVCDSCALRLRGFELAGIPDPIEYETRPHYSNV